MADAPPAMVQAPAAAATLQSKIAGLPVNFGNPVALRVAFVMSLAIMLLEMIPGVQLFFLLWWLAAGWCAVLLYRRLTGTPLSVPAGARLGSITGVLTFVSMAITSALAMAFTGKQIMEQFQQDPQMAQVVKDPPMFAAVLLLGLAVSFALVVGICAAGGALCARFNPGRFDATGNPR